MPFVFVVFLFLRIYVSRWTRRGEKNRGEEKEEEERQRGRNGHMASDL